MPPVQGHQAMLSVALINLVENAVAHAPADSVVEVEITTPARISVLDRGRGVAEEDRTRIFERFQRGMTPQPGGAGLGLAIVAEVATAHGGRIRVEPRDGGGACFVLDLSPVASGAGR